MNGWCEAEQHSCQERHPERQPQDRPVQLRTEQRVAPARQQRRQGSRTRNRQHDAGYPADQREQQALGQQLPDDAQATRTEAHAHGHFSPPRGRAFEQQARDARAGDGQNHHDHREQHEQGFAVISAHAVETRRSHRNLEPRCIAQRILVRDIRGKELLELRTQRCFDLLAADAWSQTRPRGNPIKPWIFVHHERVADERRGGRPFAAG